MSSLFVFTASNPSAQRHWTTSIVNPISPQLVSTHVSQEKLPLLRDATGRFFAWGAQPGTANVRNWERMRTGDYVLGYFNKAYHCITRVLAKHHSPECAKAVWGIDNDPNSEKYGTTWEYMYFLDEPQLCSVAADQVEDILGQGFQGFARVSDIKLEAIRKRFGSVDGFIEWLPTQGSRTNSIPTSPTSTPPPQPPPDPLVESEALLAEQGAFSPEDQADAREWVNRAVVLRRGQKQFRDKLLLAYGERCAITGFDCVDVLEAAHISPYLGEHTNDVTNGILLRADIHTLFDLGLFTIDPTSMAVELNGALPASMYAFLQGKTLRVPMNPQWRPSEAALSEHRRWSTAKHSYGNVQAPQIL